MIIKKKKKECDQGEYMQIMSSITSEKDPQKTEMCSLTFLVIFQFQEWEIKMTYKLKNIKRLNTRKQVLESTPSDFSG